MNAKQAIECSESHDEIVTLEEFTEADYQTLLVGCDDYVVANGMMEFWSNDPESDGKMAWRVHMPVAAAAVAS